MPSCFERWQKNIDFCINVLEQREHLNLDLFECLTRLWEFKASWLLYCFPQESHIHLFPSCSTSMWAFRRRFSDSIFPTFIALVTRQLSFNVVALPNVPGYSMLLLGSVITIGAKVKATVWSGNLWGCVLHIITVNGLIFQCYLKGVNSTRLPKCVCRYFHEQWFPTHDIKECFV